MGSHSGILELARDTSMTVRTDHRGQIMGSSNKPGHGIVGGEGFCFDVKEGLFIGRSAFFGVGLVLDNLPEGVTAFMGGIVSTKKNGDHTVKRAAFTFSEEITYVLQTPGRTTAESVALTGVRSLYECAVLGERPPYYIEEQANKVAGLTGDQRLAVFEQELALNALMRDK